MIYCVPFQVTFATAMLDGAIAGCANRLAVRGRPCG